LGDGVAAPVDPLSFATDPNVQVVFGFEGIAVTPSFAGAAPNFVGLYQINAEVPPTGLQIVGPNVPVAISTSTAFTDFADIAIAF
jgi:uncharacterized protein (TIGR03437 family)